VSKNAADLIAEGRSIDLFDPDKIPRLRCLVRELADALETERVNRECSDRRIARLHADISATELGPLAAKLDDDNWGTAAGALRRAAAKIVGLETGLAVYHARDAEDAAMAAAFDKAEAEAEREEKARQERRDREYQEELHLASLRPDE